MQPPNHPPTDPNEAQEGAEGQDEPSAVYSTTAAIAAEYGPEVAIETTAQCLDIYCGEAFGVGDILRDAWRLLVQEILRWGPAAAASSGAAHELEFYGRPEHVVTRINDHYYVCDECGAAGSERWAILHQFPARSKR